MHFGRLENIENVDFSLPGDHPANTKYLKESIPSKKPEVYIGCPVWTDRGYVGKLYPPKTRSEDFLYHYCRQFNGVEVNATHYNIPHPSVIKKWKEAAVPGFKFSPKFPQVISHRKDFYERNELIDHFIGTVYELGQNLGRSFIQFPPYLKPDQLENIYRFLESLTEDFETAVEVRHENWFNNPSVLEEFGDMLNHFKTPLVITDVSGRRDVLHQMLTCNEVFIRFTGNNLHPTDYTRVDAWIKRLITWLEQGVQKIYFYMHEPEKHNCADLATYMINQINQLTNLNLQPPQIYSGNQKGLFE